jgi:hypothetical protein
MQQLKRLSAATAALALSLGASSAAHAQGGMLPVAQGGGFLQETLQALARVPTYGWIALLAASIIGGCAYVGTMINQMRRDQRMANEHNERRDFEMLSKQRERDVADLLASEDGWQQLIAQVAADATATGVALEDSGVLNATIQPTPYFTVRAVDGREFCFAVDPEKLKEARVITKSARLVEVTRRGSLTAAVDLHLVWNRLTIQRRLDALTLPRHARWFCIIKNPEVVDVKSGGRRTIRAAYSKR